jgi:hypothetical protein
MQFLSNVAISCIAGYCCKIAVISIRNTSTLSLQKQYHKIDAVLPDKFFYTQLSC